MLCQSFSLHPTPQTAHPTINPHVAISTFLDAKKLSEHSIIPVIRTPEGCYFIQKKTNPDPVQCNTLRDEWSRLKAAATQLERVDGRKQWVKHADNLDRAVSDGRTDLVFAAARAMSGNSSRSAAVTPLYNSDGIVQYDPTSILRVMQGHYGSLAADTTGHYYYSPLLQRKNTTECRH
ncbi:hypothetical protein BASA83_007061 [Batrachochytrium salamandrivorans]|nr:hypothetical protein BASA83_007061 [Batrachochytrium salamandrivorans]